MKRLSIAVEAIDLPGLLVLDEPTSGESRNFAAAFRVWVGERKKLLAMEHKKGVLVSHK